MSRPHSRVVVHAPLLSLGPIICKEATWSLPEVGSMAKSRGLAALTRRKGEGWRALPAGRRALVVAGAAMLLLAAASAAPQAADVLGIAQPLTVLLQSLMIAAVPLAGIGLIFLCIGWWVGNQALILGGLGVAALGGPGPPRRCCSAPPRAPKSTRPRPGPPCARARAREPGGPARRLGRAGRAGAGPARAGRRHAARGGGGGRVPVRVRGPVHRS